MTHSRISATGSLRLLRAISICLIVLIVAGYAMRRRYDTERLCPWTFNGEVVIDNGRVFYTGYTWRDGVQVDAAYAQSVYGGKPATVFTSPPETAIGSLAIRGASVFFRAWPSISPAEALRVGVDAGPAAQPLKEGASPTVARPPVRVPPSDVLMSVPIQGGIPRKLGVVGSSLEFTESTAYWIDGPSGDGRALPRSRKPEVADRVDRRLMALSLMDGANRVVATGLPEKCSLVGSQEAVFWSTPAVGAPHRIDLHVLREHEVTSSTIRDLPEEAAGNRPAFSGSRIYWLERSGQQKPEAPTTARRIITAEKGPDGAFRDAITMQADPNTAPAAMRVVTASLDGSARRVLATARIELMSA